MNATAELVTRTAPESYSLGLRAHEGEWAVVASPLAFAACRLPPGQREEEMQNTHGTSKSSASGMVLFWSRMVLGDVLKLGGVSLGSVALAVGRFQ